jgi:hypothetical protein
MLEPQSNLKHDWGPEESVQAEIAPTAQHWASGWGPVVGSRVRRTRPKRFEPAQVLTEWRFW